MAGSFSSTNQLYLRNAAAPIIGSVYPLTIGVWVKSPSPQSAQRAIVAFSDLTTADGWGAIGQDTSQWAIQARVGSTAQALVGTITDGWTFLVGRFISATNRRLAVLHPDGSIATGQNTTSRTFSTVNAMTVGAFELSTGPGRWFTGSIAEFWYAALDIQADGAALSDALMRQLAYGGPFSVPHIAPKVVEYRSLRAHPVAGQGRDLYVGAGAGAQSWSNVNGVTIGPHPPLPYWYANPRQRRVVLPF